MKDLSVDPQRTVPIGDPPCYRAGSRIATPDGDVRIEDLSIGSMVLTAGGRSRPVRWLGHRAFDCAKYRQPSTVWPVCIHAHAFEANVPVRDLWVSPGHSVFVDDVLIPASLLINGATIVQVPLGRVEYWHVELDSHDILMAEGLAAESYLDTGNRTAFLEGGDSLIAYPEFESSGSTGSFCAPRVTDGMLLQRIKSRLLERAEELGFVMSDDSDVHIVADGQRIDPVFLNSTRLSFLLPAACADVGLRCRTFIPAQVNPRSEDQRPLGVCVGRLQMDGTEVALDGKSLSTQGWHDIEHSDEGISRRWTRDQCPLPAGTRLVVLDVASRSFCWKTQSPGSAVRAA